MVDFKKLASGRTVTRPIDPRELFHSLVRDPRFPYLRDPQGELLAEWFARRAKDRDAIFKMNTGSGKTVVALLALQSSLNEGVTPALYLCPNKQLVDQVVAEASDLGLPVCRFDKESNDIPLRFLDGSAILVTTFQKVFNGRSVFGLAGDGRKVVEVGAVVIDDAHACLDIARRSSSVTATRSTKLGKSISALVSESLSEQAPGRAASIESGDPSTFMAVPAWSWQNKQEGVTKILADASSVDELKFTWNLIRDHLPLATCVEAGTSWQISPPAVPHQMVPAFDRARRRIFLSATLMDDSGLIRDFGLSPDAVLHPMRSSVQSDVGERLIISPLIANEKLTASVVRDVCVELAKSLNVVVLVPSTQRSAFWGSHGATIGVGDSVASCIDTLRSSEGNLIVLVNRYDGVDLPNAACRVLVIDGMPSTTSLADQHESSVRTGSGIFRRIVAQRLEQGLGRCIRSESDYSVVLLITHDVVSFLSHKDTVSSLTPATRRQLEIGKNLSEMISDVDKDKAIILLTEVIDQCISQDPSWKKYHKEQMLGLSPPTDPNAESVQLAVSERNAISESHSGRFESGAQMLSSGLDACRGLDDPDKGWYLQIIAAIQHQFDPVLSQRTQTSAHALNRQLARPISGPTYSRISADKLSQAARILSWAKDYPDHRAIPAALGAVCDRCAFGTPATEFEGAVRDLGVALGFVCQLPEREFGKGPDVLWALGGSTFLVIECKDMVVLGRPKITKSEASQLSNSVHWFQTEYADAKCLPLLIHPATTLAADAYPPDGTLVLDPSGMKRLMERVRNWAAIIASRPLASWTVEDISAELNAVQLTAGSISSVAHKVKR